MKILIFKKEYSLEELADIDRDVSEAWEDIPKRAPMDSTVEVTITWTQED